MSCIEKEKLFQGKLESTQALLNSELRTIEIETERKAKDIATEFEADNDLAAGVGATAGTVIGTAFGGPVGGTTGAVVGKAIGELFTLDVSTARQEVALDVPQVTMKTKDLSYDLPSVVMKNTDIVFDMPTIEMRRKRGPDVPHVTIRWKVKCKLGICTKVPQTTVEMRPTYYDSPTVVMVSKRIVIGIPEVEMRRQTVKIDLPEIAMKRTTFSADLPVITLRFVKDAGKRTAAQAAALAMEAQSRATQKQIEFDDRLRSEALPLLVDVFACHRETINQSRAGVLEAFNQEIQRLSDAVTALLAQGLPVESPEVIAARSSLDVAISRRQEAVSPFDEALISLSESEREAIAQFLGEHTSTMKMTDILSEPEESMSTSFSVNFHS